MNDLVDGTLAPPHTDHEARTMARGLLIDEYHRFRANMYDVLMEPFERWRFRQCRRALVEDLSGSVLEIGAGTGLSFPFYRPGVNLTATEPMPEMAKLAQERASRMPFTARVEHAEAASLPFEDESFDAIV